MRAKLKSFLIRLVVVLLIIFVLIGIVSLVSVPGIAPDDVAGMQASFDKRTPALMEKYHVPGVAIVLIRDGAIESAHYYGYADLAADIPVTEDTVFQVASISKPVSAWAVMTLVEAGKISLDDPIFEHISRWELPPSEYDPEAVTVRRVLSHTAGLSLHGYAGFPDGDGLQSIEESLTYAADASKGVELVAPPGSKWSYSGGGYTLLQLMIEEVTGQPFATVMQTTVLDPLGMTHSSFDPTPEILTVTAAPYDSKGERIPVHQYTSQAAAGLYTTLLDLATWLTTILDKPTGVLTPETVEQMLTPVEGAQISLGPINFANWGLGYSLDNVLFSDLVMVGHTGSNEGYQAAAYAFPETGDGIVIMTNADLGWKVHGRLSCSWLEWVTRSTTASCVPTRIERYWPIIIVVALAVIISAFVFPRRRTAQQINTNPTPM